VLEPFFTTKSTGTGLGLAVVKRIVDEHEGELDLDSSPGQGANFTLWLPAARAGHDETGAASEPVPRVLD
jgi:signal transduction histidine kinase